MSELKPYIGPHPTDHTLTEYYLKSKADKVIAEKDAAIADLIEKNKRLANKDLIMASETIKGMFDELRHQKYKRCLAMAKLCNEKWLVHNFAEIPTKLGFYDKWEKRWLAIAEKFKPNKEAK